MTRAPRRVIGTEADGDPTTTDEEGHELPLTVYAWPDIVTLVRGGPH